MEIYLILAFLIIINLFIKIKFFSYVILFFLFIVSSLRWNVGYDFYEYVTSYYSALVGEYDLIRFPLIFKGIYYFSVYLNSERFFFIFTSFLSILFIFHNHKKHNIELNLVIFFVYFTSIYFNSFNQIRQVLSILIFLIGTRELIKENYIKYFVCYICFFFHLTILYLLILPLLLKFMIKFKVITLLIVLILSFFLSEYLIGFLSFITENISALGEYSYHLANESFIKMDQGNYIVKIFKNLAAVMYLLFIYNKSENSMKKYS